MEKHKIARSLLTAAALASLVACSSYATRPAAPAMTSGGILTGTNGMTLYTFDKDVAGSGKSVCNGPCATNWPPLFAADSDAVAGDYGIIVRDDGKKQWAYKGKPLYFWIKDQQPGDKSGHGVNQVWRTATP